MRTFVVGLVVLALLGFVAFVLVRTGNGLPIAQIDVSHFATTGSTQAPNEVIVFSDHLCPACRKYFNEVTLPKLKPMVTAGRLRIVFVTFPIKEGSTEVSQVVECVRESQGVDPFTLYEHVYNADYHHKSQAQVIADLARAGLPSTDQQADMARCASSPRVAALIDRERYVTILHGISLVPTVVLNRQLLADPWDMNAFEGMLK